MRTAQEPTALRPVRPRPTARGLLTVLLVAAVIAAVAAVDWEAGLLSTGGLQAARSMAASLLSPDLSPAFLLIVADAALVTISYAIAGTTVALAIGLPGALLVSGALARRPLVRTASATASRGVFGTLRAVHELVWALLLLTILGLTPLAGVLAIGIPYGATIARVLGERLQDVPDEPLQALRSTGASSWHVLCYGRVPLAAADLSAYLFYRFECAIRAAAVLSFIGLGGIGYRMEIALADLRFEQVWTLLVALVVIVTVVDALSGRVRRGLVG